jgi:hypothetical protein
MTQRASHPTDRAVTSPGLAPVCAQCSRPMKIERIEPDQGLGLITVFRCEQCRLKDQVWASRTEIGNGCQPAGFGDLANPNSAPI